MPPPPSCSPAVTPPRLGQVLYSPCQFRSPTSLRVKCCLAQHSRGPGACRYRSQTAQNSCCALFISAASPCPIGAMNGAAIWSCNPEFPGGSQGARAGTGAGGKQPISYTSYSHPPQPMHLWRCIPWRTPVRSPLAQHPTYSIAALLCSIRAFGGFANL